MVRAKWKAAQSTNAPKAIDFTTCAGYVYLAKDIVETEVTDDSGNTVTYYDYTSASFTTAEYEEYLADIEAPSTTSIMQALSDVQAEQELGSAVNDAGTETIMQAISDIQADIALLDI